MGDAEYIAGLEARAAQIQCASFGEGFEFCSVCRQPMEKYREIMYRLHNCDVCNLCHALHQAVFERTFFVNAQAEFNERKKNLNRLRSGGDYFDK